jgi:O-acetyl-ADP-ribose deacetylase (regulator of RNase III)
MITFKIGNIFDAQTQAIVNTVNTDGIMGKGIALQFKNRFPLNTKAYEKACKEKEIGIGRLLITRESTIIDGEKWIINFPTKTTWRKPSEYSYIESGLKDLVNIIQEKNIKSIAIPPLGAGNGGLNWASVKILISQYLNNLDCEIVVYEPNAQVQEIMKSERVKLTSARAMLLAVFYELVRHGEFISEFSGEKIAYFLQRFGAESEFNLEFKPQQYGPYSGKVKRVLYHLNGSYISGYSTMDKKPFEEMGLVMDAEPDVLAYLQSTDEGKWMIVVDKTKQFLNGFYSDFALELLSSVDFIKENTKAKTSDEILDYIVKWNKRKRELFNNKKYIEIAVQRIDSIQSI